MIKTVKNKKASYLAASSSGIIKYAAGLPDAEITSVEYDSRKVGPGTMFVAVKGFAADGHAYIKNAVDAGASAVVVSPDRLNEFLELSSKTVIYTSSDTRRALSILAASFFDFPSVEMDIIGVTGTNGKTSITYMLESILKKAGMNPGVIGTINYRWAGKTLSAPNTTPESRDIQEILYNMLEDGVDCVVMEVSSHALALGRVEDIDFNCAIFTNLTGDHLDFHSDMEDYFSAKMRLFALLDKGVNEIRCAVVNADDEYCRRIIDMKKDFSFPVNSFGVSNADYMPDADSIENKITGLSYKLKKPFPMEVNLKLAGKFHVSNSLAALSAASSLGIDENIIAQGLSALENVPGRYEVIHSSEGFSAVVDYAHTGDALLKLLQSVNELSHQRIITVFGCGGDRDRTKRPVMGSIASSNSDCVIVTSDNPRTEMPGAIISEIISGISLKNFEVVEDREHAIAKAVEMAQSGDIIVVAGKGHEDYQILGKNKIHFDDREMLQKYIAKRESV